MLMLDASKWMTLVGRFGIVSLFVSERDVEALQAGGGCMLEVSEYSVDMRMVCLQGARSKEKFRLDKDEKTGRNDLYYYLPMSCLGCETHVSAHDVNGLVMLLWYRKIPDRKMVQTLAESIVNKIVERVLESRTAQNPVAWIYSQGVSEN